MRYVSMHIAYTILYMRMDYPGIVLIVCMYNVYE